MTLEEAFNILDVQETSSFEDIKLNFKWLVHFHHPDNPSSGNARELIKILKAFETIKKATPKSILEQLEKADQRDTPDGKA